eukprot:3383805-Prymnesium_polylepis.1
MREDTLGTTRNVSPSVSGSTRPKPDSMTVRTPRGAIDSSILRRRRSSSSSQPMKPPAKTLSKAIGQDEPIQMRSRYSPRQLAGNMMFSRSNGSSRR